MPTLLEKNILSSSKHPFIADLQYYFQTDERLYFVMNFIRGGELFNLLKTTKNFPESQAKFYVL